MGSHRAFIKRFGGIGLLASLALDPGRAQVLEQWSHASVFGEASAAVAMDQDYMFVADNEDEVLRLYRRAPESACAAHIYALDLHSTLVSSKKEVDLEAAVKVVSGGLQRIYWLGSHSNSKDGELRPNRERLFATDVIGDGSGAVPYSLTYLGRYDRLRADLVAWDQNNLHGKGANYFGLAASTAFGVAAERLDAFNMEGLALAPDGTTAYLAFRAPLVNGSGPTTSNDQRTNALIVPLLNMAALVAGNPGAGPAQFGTPFTLNLGGRGIRSIDSSEPSQYLITAGPPVSAGAPNNFRLFGWTGDPADEPLESATEIPAGFSPEGAMIPPGPLTSETVVQFVSDDGPGCWRSFTAHAGTRSAPLPVLPRLHPLSLANGRPTLVVSGPLGHYTLQACTDLHDWVTIGTFDSLQGSFSFVDPNPGNSPIRLYRAIFEK